ncbi:uncharacterized protein LOC123886280 [Trifolium pratense]|uniref:uncharacterized protein LOC123886280 n=1 Tax=Trifolium pratense TaxID=57577 RepID=UPI001E6973F3|nr:uncharacterized protein LOC123886280 [Trifolium pratense]
MIGSLLYLTASRPDITFVVGVCARYQVKPKMSHLVQVKRILKYVNGTSDYRILYSQTKNSTLVGYCDADWAESADDRKSTSGGCFFLGDNLISWFSKETKLWDYIYKRRLAVERELTKDALKCQDIFHLIKEAGLLKTVADFSPCYELLVKEFLVNIPEECDNPLSKDYQKVYVRGKCIDFSPTVINNYLGRSVEPKPELEVANDAVSTEITAGKVKVWPKNKLIPTRTKVDYDYGTYIFDQTVKHIRSTAVKMPIAFPSLLYGIILDQYPDIKIITDTPKKRETAFTFHHKLFGDHNVANIVGTSTGAAGPMTRMEIIAALMVTVKANKDVVADDEPKDANDNEDSDTEAATDAKDDDSGSSDEE